jgi:hypothetical protein
MLSLCPAKPERADWKYGAPVAGAEQHDRGFRGSPGWLSVSAKSAKSAVKNFFADRDDFADIDARCLRNRVLDLMKTDRATTA